MSFSSLRAAVIGTGFIGPVHIEALRRIGVRVTAICGSAKAHDVAARWDIPRVYANYDYRALAADPDVDVVHITSPNREHFPQAQAMLAAGKHVICEKPLAMSVAETAELARLAGASDRVFAVNYNVRFAPAILQLRAMVQRGDLGRIMHINGSYFQDWLLHDTDYNWRVMAEDGGALRAVGDIGTHWLDAVSFIQGAKIESVFAHLETVYKERRRPIGEVQTFTKAGAAQEYAAYPVETEDFASLFLKFDNGVHGNLAVSQVAAGRKNCLRIEIYGMQQSASWCSENPDIIQFGRRDSANATAFRACSEFQDITGFTDYPGGHVEGFPDTFKMLFRAIYTEIQNGKSARPLYATAADGHHEVAVCDAVLRSARDRAWVTVQ